MNLWLVKRTGADWWGNYMHDRELTFTDDTTVYAQMAFYRRKDATKYLKTLTYPEFYEVIKATTKPTGMVEPPKANANLPPAFKTGL